MLRVGIRAGGGGIAFGPSSDSLEAREAVRVGVVLVLMVCSSNMWVSIHLCLWSLLQRFRIRAQAGMSAFSLHRLTPHLRFLRAAPLTPLSLTSPVRALPLGCATLLCPRPLTLLPLDLLEQPPPLSYPSEFNFDGSSSRKPSLNHPLDPKSLYLC